MSFYARAKQKLSVNLVRSVGSIGYFLFAFFCFRLFIRYVFNSDVSLPAGLSFIGPDGSILFWGILWGIFSVMGMVSAVIIIVRRTNLFFISAIALLSLHFVWGTAYAVGWLFKGDESAWLNMGTYFAPIGLIIGYLIGGLKSSNAPGALLEEKE